MAGTEDWDVEDLVEVDLVCFVLLPLRDGGIEWLNVAKIRRLCARWLGMDLSKTIVFL